MKVFLFHCWGGDGRSCWSGWLSDTLIAKGTTVISPDFPNTNNPKLEDWLATARKNVKTFDDDWVLVGHSLGCPAILRLLETFGQDERVGLVVLVAGFAKDLEVPQIKNFVDKKFNWPKILKSCRRFIVINSDNDPFIPLDEGKRLAEQLGADFIIEHGGGHINEGSGYSSYPLLLKILDGLK
ncbi:MAG: alpha/beta fold hydrolase [Candidatus ainarchaeum sp.]|nr:alpha/beta fold hydrolase [Candidatus ainarchaeum sp.]